MNPEKGLVESELRWALHSLGLYPSESQLKTAAKKVHMSSVLSFSQFPDFVFALGACPRGSKSLPYARRGMRLGQLQALYRVFFESGWMQKQCDSSNFIRNTEIEQGTVKKMETDAFSLERFLVRPLTAPVRLLLRDRVPFHLLERLGVPGAPDHSCSFAQLMNPKGQKVDVFVSHHWGHDFPSMLRKLESFAFDRHRELGKASPQEVVFWIGLFALDQHNLPEELGETMEQAPFNLALAKARSCLLVLDTVADPMKRAWCLYEAYRAGELGLSCHLLTNKGLIGSLQDECEHEIRAICQQLSRVSIFEASCKEDDDKFAIWYESVSSRLRQTQFSDYDRFVKHARLAGLGGFTLCADHFNDFNLRVREILVTPLLPLCLSQNHPEAAVECIGADARYHCADLEQLTNIGGDLCEAVPIVRPDLSGRAPLVYLAARRGLVDELRFLLDKEADPNAQVELAEPECPHNLPDHFGHLCTPLHAAVAVGSLAAVSLLLSRRADGNRCDADGATPLHQCSNTRIAAALLTSRADHMAKGSAGATPLHTSAHKGRTMVCAVLLDARAPVDCQADDQATPLHMAAHGGHGSAVRLLLACRADHGSARLDGAVPLHRAAGRGHLEVSILLTQARADSMQCVDETGRSAVDWAFDSGYRGLAEILAH